MHYTHLSLITRCGCAGLSYFLWEIIFHKIHHIGQEFAVSGTHTNEIELK